MIIDIKRNYKVSGKILKYIEELRQVYKPILLVFKNIELSDEDRQFVNRTRTMYTFGDGTVESVNLFQQEYRDFLIGKLIYSLEEYEWEQYDDEVTFEKGLKTIDEYKDYVVSGAYLHYIFQLALLCDSGEHKNIMLHNGKRYFTPKGDLIKEKDSENEIIEEVNGLKDILIGKLVSEFEKNEWEEQNEA